VTPNSQWMGCDRESWRWSVMKKGWLTSTTGIEGWWKKTGGVGGSRTASTADSLSTTSTELGDLPQQRSIIARQLDSTQTTLNVTHAHIMHRYSMLHRYRLHKDKQRSQPQISNSAPVGVQSVPVSHSLESSTCTSTWAAHLITMYLDLLTPRSMHVKVMPCTVCLSSLELIAQVFFSFRAWTSRHRDKQTDRQTDRQSHRCHRSLNTRISVG